MKKNFNKELWHILKEYNYHLANIVEFYIVRIDNLGERAIIKGDMNNFKEELLKFNDDYYPDENISKNNFHYGGWITFDDNSFIKRRNIYDDYYDEGTEEWEYVKFPRIVDMVEKTK